MPETVCSVETYTLYRAECDCGWKGFDRTTSELAHADKEEHEATCDGTPYTPTEPDTVFAEELEDARPVITSLVKYRSKTGNYDLPAVVNCTRETIDAKGVELGHVPALSADDCVHLTVFTPGKEGTSRGEMDTIGLSVNKGGSYTEWDIPFDDSEEPAPGTWRW